MKTEIRHPLANAILLTQPVVVSGLTVHEYLNLLRFTAESEKATFRYSANVAINLFERWLLSKYQHNSLMRIDEDILDQFRSDLKAGYLLREDGKTYESLSGTAPTSIRAIHNLAANSSDKILRTLINHNVSRRLMRFLSYSHTTQDLLLHVEQKGRRATSRNGRSNRPLTERTRQQAIDCTMIIMDQLKVMGIEEITNSDVIKLYDDATKSGNYRTIARTLHNAEPAFRIGHELGMLPLNVLQNVDHDTFKEHARRDFLPPTEVDKVLDLSTVVMKDWHSVRDRLVPLLLYDLGIRKSELAALRTDDVSNYAGYSEVRLRTEIQKNNKREITLRVLFPATQRLLKHYLEKIRGHHPGEALIVSMKGQGASPSAIEAAVKREAERLNLICYNSDRRPTPHAFRRTFATINSHPLGLGMTVHELADRLRDSIKVVDESYRLRNPLVERSRADFYHQKLNGVDSAKSIRKAISELEGAGLPRRLLGALMRWESRHRVEPVTASQKPDDDWLPEADVLAHLKQHWENLPTIRRLREYFRIKDALRRHGAKGQIEYRRRDVHDLATAYTPITDHMTASELSSQSVRGLLAAHKMIELGSVKLITVAEFPTLSKALTGLREQKLSCNRTGKTEARNRAKQNALSRFQPDSMPEINSTPKSYKTYP